MGQAGGRGRGTEGGELVVLRTGVAVAVLPAEVGTQQEKLRTSGEGPGTSRRQRTAKNHTSRGKECYSFDLFLQGPRRQVPAAHAGGRRPRLHCLTGRGT